MYNLHQSATTFKGPEVAADWCISCCDRDICKIWSEFNLKINYQITK